MKGFLGRILVALCWGGGMLGWGVVSRGAESSTEPPSEEGRKDGFSREVVGVRDSQAFQDYVANVPVIASMLHEGLVLVAGPGVDEKRPLSAFVGPDDVVGIKVNTEGGLVAGTKRGLVEALVAELGRAGVPPHRIIVWDKREEWLVAAGYRPANRPKALRVLSVLPGQIAGTSAGFDPEVFYRGTSVGELIWGDLEFRGSKPSPKRELAALAEKAANRRRKEGKLSEPFATAGIDSGQEEVLPQASSKSHLTRIVTQMCTKLIHVPTLSDNVALGLNGAMASLALGSVDNWRRFMFAPDEAAALAEICAMPALKDKLVLTILDATYTQYAGGPGFVPTYGAVTNTLYFSRDIVALDALGLELIDARRRAVQIPTLSEISTWVAAAGELGLGEADRHRVKVRWADESERRD